MNCPSRRKRPKGITLLALLHLMGGLLFSGVLIAGLFIDLDPKVNSFLGSSGVLIPLLAAVVLMGFLGLESGVGMWRGSKWGWYLGSFYYFFSAAKAIGAFLSVDDFLACMPPEAGPPSLQHRSQYLHFKSGMQFLISLLIVIYFYRGKVREFFGLGTQQKWKVVVAQVVLCIGLVEVFGVDWENPEQAFAAPEQPFAGDRYADERSFISDRYADERWSAGDRYADERPITANRYVDEQSFTADRYANWQPSTVDDR